MRGVYDWMRSYKNMEATHSYVARASQCLGMRGDHTTPYGDAGAATIISSMNNRLMTSGWTPSSFYYLRMLMDETSLHI